MCNHDWETRDDNCKGSEKGNLSGHIEQVWIMWKQGGNIDRYIAGDNQGKYRKSGILFENVKRQNDYDDALCMCEIERNEKVGVSLAVLVKLYEKLCLKYYIGKGRKQPRKTKEERETDRQRQRKRETERNRERQRERGREKKRK